MKRLVFLCGCIVLVLCLVTCHRDMSVDTIPVYERGVYILSPMLEFSNYQVTDKITIEYYKLDHPQWHVDDIPAWLNVTPSSGKLLYGKTTLVFSVDTTKSIPADSVAQLKIITKDVEAKISYEYIKLTSLPQQIIAAGNQYVISRLGENYFNKHVKLDKHKSRFHQPYDFCLENPESCASYLQNPYYNMVYYISVPNIPEPGAMIDFILDTTGTVIVGEDSCHNHFPDCIKNPGECEFPISETQAIAIARNDGLEEGVKPWNTSFYWYSEEVKSYVWCVRNTIEESNPGTFSYSAYGRSIIIDANTGKVVSRHQWMAMS